MSFVIKQVDRKVPPCWGILHLHYTEKIRWRDSILQHQRHREKRVRKSQAADTQLSSISSKLIRLTSGPSFSLSLDICASHFGRRSVLCDNSQPLTTAPLTLRRIRKSKISDNNGERVENPKSVLVEGPLMEWLGPSKGLYQVVWRSQVHLPRFGK